MDVRVKESFKKKLVRNRLKWAGHVEIIDDGKIANRADAQKMEGNGSEEDRHCNRRTALRKT